MATPTDTETRELLGAIATLSQRIEVGFTQVDTKLSDLRGEVNLKLSQVDTKLSSLQGEMNLKFSQVDTKLSSLQGEVNLKFSQVDTKLAKIEGDINLLRQPRDFWDFVKKGMAVTVFSGFLLTFGKFILTGKVM